MNNFSQKKRAENLYQERILSRWTVVIASAVTGAMLFMLIYQIIVGPVGDRPAPDWFFLIMFLLFLGITINFSLLRITITTDSLNVAYGIFKRTIPWREIENCYFDNASIINYGGWGIRIGRVRGKWRLVYNVIESPRVVLTLKTLRFKEFVFSTNQPDKVMAIVKQRVSPRLTAD
jgi:hypothetical protein